MTKPHRPDGEETGRVIAGLQPVREAIRAAPGRLRAVLIDRGGSPRLEALARFAGDSGVETIERVATGRLDRLARGVSHQGAVALAEALALAEPGSVLARSDLLAVALDQIQDPQNFGAVVRSAVAIADAPVLWGEHASAPLSTATFRASAGAIEHATLCRVASLVQTLIEASERGVTVVGLDGSADTELSPIDLRGPTILVVGAEHTGMARGVRRACAHLVSLGTMHRVGSLNVSVAAGVALYEATKQRAIPSS